jgi:hypothetical protein
MIGKWENRKSQRVSRIRTYKRVGGPESRSGRWEVNKIILLQPEIEPQSLIS